MINWGDIPVGTVIPFPFAAFGTNGESLTLSGLATTDIEVYKGTSMMQRASDNGFALLDTDGIDIDSRTGIHGFSIDTGDNSDSGFYVAGSMYYVVVDAVTINAQTVRFIAGTFRLTAGESVSGVPEVDVTHWLGTAAATPTVAGVPEVDVTHWIGTAAATPTVAGVPEVDLTHVAGSTTSVSVLASNVATLTAAIITLASTTGTVTTDAGNSATSFETNLSQTADDHWNKAFLLITSGALLGQIRPITAYNGTTKIVTVSPGFTGTPADGVTFAIVNR